MDRKRMLRLLSLVALAGGLAAAMPLAERWPREQTIHYVLGDGAPRLRELEARWVEAKVEAKVEGEGDGDSTSPEALRDATFHFAPGQAPRIVTHVPRLADGDYLVDIDLASGDARATVSRHVTLSGGATSIDLSGSVPR
jgi:hypothetical protein